MISCADAVGQLWRYLDESLAPQDQRLVEEHLGVCRQCCGELEFAKVLQDVLVKQQAGDELPPDVRARMEQLVKELKG